MTTVQLPQRWIEQLTHLPESGMGYQRVDIRLKEGKILKGMIVLNAEEVQAPEPFEPSEIVDVQLAR